MFSLRRYFELELIHYYICHKNVYDLKVLYFSYVSHTKVRTAIEMTTTYNLHFN